MRRALAQPSLTVQVYDPRARRSRSLTVYTTDLDDVARTIEDAVSRRWRATKLNDRRHKRR